MADIAASGFLSTPSARRATLRLRQSPGVVVISIHALREEGDVDLVARIVADDDISIHALREEGDTLATTLAKTYKISIHALREEGDPRAILLC